MALGWPQHWWCSPRQGCFADSSHPYLSSHPCLGINGFSKNVCVSIWYQRLYQNENILNILGGLKRCFRFLLPSGNHADKLFWKQTNKTVGVTNIDPTLWSFKLFCLKFAFGKSGLYITGQTAFTSPCVLMFKLKTCKTLTKQRDTECAGEWCCRGGSPCSLLELSLLQVRLRV